MTNRYITIGDKAIRAITFLQSGQRVVQWLPAGTYENLGEHALLWHRDHPDQVRTLLLASTSEPTGQWYVSLRALAKLVPTHETGV